MMTDHILKFLSTIELLNNLSVQELNNLAGDFSLEQYSAGTDIIQSGVDDFRFFILVSGRAEVINSKKGNNPFLVHNSFVSGECFGEISLFTGRPSPVTVRAMDDCTVLTMNREKFDQMLARWPKLYENFSYRLSSLINLMDDHLWESRYREFLRNRLQLEQLQQKFYGFWGGTKSAKQAEKAIAQLASCQHPLLIVGERGTGKQMMAWYIHKQQFGEAAPFIVIDAHHFDQQWGDLLFKSRQQDGRLTLVKGANLLDIAEGGTLFIRDINLISHRNQQKLAETLQFNEANCRVIGSLVSDPETLSHSINHKLRECFTQNYKIQPLRMRKRDISVIAQGVLDKLAAQNNSCTPVLCQEAVSFLLAHDYQQGNVTELIRVIERAFYLTDDKKISVEHLFFGSGQEKGGKSIDLLTWGWVKRLVTSGVLPRWVKKLVTAVFLGLVVLFLINPNFKAVTLIFAAAWGFGWPALTIFSPTFGRVWCTICPFSGVMEWIQKYIHFGLPVPELLKKYDYLIVTFLFFGGFWVEEMTEMRHHPLYTGILVLSVVIVSSVIGVFYIRSAWCRHLCPIGNFIGVASVGSFLEVRSNTTVCLNKCTSYECYRGNQNKGISGCPTSQYMPLVDNNLDCILCLQCVRLCPNDAVELNLRVPAQEVWQSSRINQGYVIFVAAALAVLPSLFYFRTGDRVSGDWKVWFSLSYWGAIAVVTSLTWLFTRPFHTESPSKRIRFIFALIPLVLAGYIVYQLGFVPGLSSFVLGLGWKSSQGITGYYISGLAVGQILAVFAGCAVTLYSIAKVFVFNYNIISTLNKSHTK